MRSSTLLAVGLSLGGTVASPFDLFRRKDTCNHDNLYRCFVDQRYSVIASNYCGVLQPYTSTVGTTTATT